jgi:putative endonuclease
LWMKQSWVYIMTNPSRTLYIGVTSDLENRIARHKAKTADGFTRRYNITMLVHVEEFAYIGDAIAREKQVKGWSRAKKIALNERENPHWLDLSRAGDEFVGLRGPAEVPQAPRSGSGPFSRDPSTGSG